jgi:hypothetical protein
VTQKKSMTDKQWAALARDVQRAFARVDPSWTDPGTHDPGITVLEALAWAIENLGYRQPPLDEHGRRLAQRIAAGVAAWTAHEADDCGPGLQRVNFFSGRLLGADDLNAEQQYLRGRWSRLNRALHGAGIVAGLDVSVETDPAGSRVVIAPGLAFDPAGREIAVCEPATLALPHDGAALFVLLRYAERPCRLAPVVPGVSSEDDATTAPTRIVETFDAELAAASATDTVAIGRLKRSRGRWRIDAAYAPPKVRRDCSGPA